MLNQRSDKAELLRIAESVAAEKSIDTEIILSTMESAIQKAAKQSLDRKMTYGLKSTEKVEI